MVGQKSIVLGLEGRGGKSVADEKHDIRAGCVFNSVEPCVRIGKAGRIIAAVVCDDFGIELRVGRGCIGDRVILTRFAGCSTVKADQRQVERVARVLRGLMGV